MPRVEVLEGGAEWWARPKVRGEPPFPSLQPTQNWPWTVGSPPLGNNTRFSVLFYRYQSLKLASRSFRRPSRDPLRASISFLSSHLAWGPRVGSILLSWLRQLLMSFPQIYEMLPLFMLLFSFPTTVLWTYSSVDIQKSLSETQDYLLLLFLE